MAINATISAKRLAKALQDGYSVIVQEGGSSSGKTYGTVFVLILLAHDPVYRKKILGEKWPSIANKKLRISIVSDSLPHIKKGALRDFKANMDDLALWDVNNWNATDYIYTFQDGSYIELFGLEDESKAKGPRRDILFMNEANNNKVFVYNQLSMRTTGPKILDLNPSEYNSWVYTLADNPENKRLHSTYLDNIQNLSQSQIDFIESYKNLPDPFLWKVYGLGERGASKELIYTYYRQVAEIPETNDIAFGLDFGFNHPSALIKCSFVDGVCYAEEKIYQSNLTTPQLIALLKEHVGRYPVYCDSARPDLIEEIHKAGIVAKKADKDVFAGILAVKKQDLRIHASSRNLLREMGSYKWDTDKDGNIISPERPVKQNDDAVDALRYGIFTHIGKPKIILFSV